jgi:glucoamylase
MFPEQIWDGPETDGWRLGMATGAAMPLVWAHSEYLKLLRSAADGRVFDRISAVERRYGSSRVASKIEVFKMRRPIREIPAGSSLRIINENRFRVHWSIDGWATANDTESSKVGYSGSYADLPTAAEQSGTISFTLFWPDENRWEGRNFSVEISRES